MHLNINEKRENAADGTRTQEEQVDIILSIGLQLIKSVTPSGEWFSWIFSFLCIKFV